MLISAVQPFLLKIKRASVMTGNKIADHTIASLAAIVSIVFFPMSDLRMLIQDALAGQCSR